MDVNGNNRFAAMFDSRDEMILGAQHLLGCHPHHFYVQADWNQLSGLSQMAVDCLEEYFNVR